jgi:hypothetical protein
MRFDTVAGLIGDEASDRGRVSRQRGKAMFRAPAFENAEVGRIRLSRRGSVLIAGKIGRGFESIPQGDRDGDVGDDGRNRDGGVDDDRKHRAHEVSVGIFRVENCTYRKQRPSPAKGGSRRVTCNFRCKSRGRVHRSRAWARIGKVRCRPRNPRSMPADRLPSSPWNEESAGERQRSWGGDSGRPNYRERLVFRRGNGSSLLC